MPSSGRAAALTTWQSCLQEGGGGRGVARLLWQSDLHASVVSFHWPPCWAMHFQLVGWCPCRLASGAAAGGTARVSPFMALHAPVPSEGNCTPYRNPHLGGAELAQQKSFSKHQNDAEQQRCSSDPLPTCKLGLGSQTKTRECNWCCSLQVCSAVHDGLLLLFTANLNATPRASCT